MCLEHAAKMCALVVSHCKQRGFAPVAVVVVDSHASVVCSMVMDGCPPFAYPKYAQAKATTAVSFGISSRAFRDRYISAPEKIAQMNSMIASADGQICGFPGGVLLSQEGSVIGAIGVSGAASDQDELLGLLAAREVGGFILDPPSSPLD